MEEYGVKELYDVAIRATCPTEIAGVNYDSDEVILRKEGKKK